jgi:type I restriction enzyme, S subunit
MEVKPGYKQTEVGVIPEDWKVQKVSDFAELLSSKRIFESDYVSTGVPFYRGTEITLLIENQPLPKEYFISEPRYIQIQKKYGVPGKGDILITAVGTLGNVYLVPDDRHFYFKDGNLIWLRGVQDIDGRYLAIQLRNQRSRIIGNAIGSTQKALTIVTLNETLLPVPLTKAEQEAIAGALSDADALIESLEQLINKKRQVKQGAMQELLTGKKRLPGFSGKWEVRQLGQLASIQRGASPRPINSPIWFDENSSVGWVRISDVTKSGMYLRKTTQRLSVLGVQHSRPVGRGSLIMSICATVGRPIITKIDTCIHDGFVVFDNLRTDKYFLYYILSSIEGDWSRHGQTGSQMNLNTGLINRTEIRTSPTTKEQIAIAAILSDMDEDITALEAKLAKTRQIKQGMMQELLTGRIRLI